MGRRLDVKSKSAEKTIKNFLNEKMVIQKQEKHMNILETSRKTLLKNIDNEASMLKEELKSYGRGMTRLSSYLKKSKTDPNQNTIWFPLERTATDWEPKPCCIGNAASTHKCFHFPCRTMTSYHFMFRELPQSVLDDAELSVQRSKTRIRTKPGPDVSGDNEAFRTKRQTFDSTKPWRHTQEIKLPPIDFPEGITPKEKKLKLIIEKKRLQNKLENKPIDRNVNYGKPTPVRRLQRPVRPVLRKMDVR